MYILFGGHSYGRISLRRWVLPTRFDPETYRWKQRILHLINFTFWQHARGQLRDFFHRVCPVQLT